jgi:predicted secreted hydrolase
MYARLISALVLLGACSSEAVEVRARLSLAQALATGDTSGYVRVMGPRPFRFPEDHGPHPGYRVEWWYFTGNLAAADGRRFGFQLTFFRSAQTAVQAARTSAWAATDVWMAHFALTDVAGRRFHAVERLARGAAGLAGAQARPLRVWIEDWDVSSAAPGAAFPVRLRAASEDVAVDLILESGKPVTAQGDAGFSAKGPEPGNASLYYSLTRMPARGTLTIAGEQLAVSGAAWMDREWSTSALGTHVVGWDWLALQLDDGRDVMLYRLRRDDGTADPFSAGTLVEADGRAIRLAVHDFVLEPQGEWRSPIDGTAYPAAWRVQVPAHALDLTVTPVLPEQELNLTVRYWEGAVDVAGTIRGRGYLEMTGYSSRHSSASRSAF